MAEYPEIERLKQYFADHEIGIVILGQADKSYTYWVNFSVNGHSWKLYVDDEYNDLKAENPVMALFLILSSLQEYQDSSDFLEWCRNSDIEVSDTWLQYYRSLDKIVREIEFELGEIEPVISQYDYGLSSGIISELRSL